MTRHILMTTLIVLSLAGCTRRLSDEDQALLMQTQSMSQEARDTAARAAQDAAAARAEANRAAQMAQVSSERASRIFEYGSSK